MSGFLSKMSVGQTRQELANNREIDAGVADENNFLEPVFSGSKIQTLTAYKDASKTELFWQKTFAYSGSKVSQIVTVVKSIEDSSQSKTITETFTYNGSKLKDRTKAVT